MLAIVFALEKWHQYTFGRPLPVYSDHKLLEAIKKKPLDRAPKRLQGMLVRALASKYSIARVSWARICSLQILLVELPFPTPSLTTKRNLKPSVPLIKYLVPACMDCLEAAAICACICFQSAGGKLIIVKRL